MLKLTTDKHEASRGLSATAELLVQRIVQIHLIIVYRMQRRSDCMRESTAATMFFLINTFLTMSKRFTPSV